MRRYRRSSRSDEKEEGKEEGKKREGGERRVERAYGVIWHDTVRRDTHDVVCIYKRKKRHDAMFLIVFSSFTQHKCVLLTFFLLIFIHLSLSLYPILFRGASS